MKRLLGLGLLLGACGGPTPVEPTTATPPAVVLEVSEPTPAEGATAMTAVCFEAERCDALDSDCDGHIDEGCPGAASAELEIGLSWNDASSLTVAVEPASAPLGGAASSGACDDATRPRRELRQVETLAPGDYRVAVVRTDACPAAEGTVASVSVSAQGRLLGTYNVTVGEARADVLGFSVASTPE